MGGACEGAKQEGWGLLAPPGTLTSFALYFRHPARQRRLALMP